MQQLLKIQKASLTLSMGNTEHFTEIKVQTDYTDHISNIYLIIWLVCDHKHSKQVSDWQQFVYVLHW